MMPEAELHCIPESVKEEFEAMMLQVITQAFRGSGGGEFIPEMIQRTFLPEDATAAEREEFLLSDQYGKAKYLCQKGYKLALQVAAFRRNA